MYFFKRWMMLSQKSRDEGGELVARVCNVTLWKAEARSGAQDKPGLHSVALSISVSGICLLKIICVH